MIANILTYIDGHGSAEQATETALQLAIRHNAHVEGLHVREEARNFLANESIYAGLEHLEKFPTTFERDAAQKEKQALETFARICERHGVAAPETASLGSQPTAKCTVVAGQAARVMSEHARVSDICVIGNPGYGSDRSTMRVIESALFDSGRPVLVAPPSPPKKVGGDIIIGWNRSATAARALNMAIPLFHKADRIRIVYVDTGTKPGPSAEEAAAYVQRHGFTAEAKIIDTNDSGAASALLSYAQDADLLVMGAYSHSRLREVVLGGATRHILENATIPVLMVH